MVLAAALRKVHRPTPAMAVRSKTGVSIRSSQKTMRDGRERRERAPVVVGHGGLTSDEVATAREYRMRPHQRLTDCVEMTTSKRRSRQS